MYIKVEFKSFTTTLFFTRTNISQRIIFVVSDIECCIPNLRSILAQVHWKAHTSSSMLVNLAETLCLMSCNLHLSANRISSLSSCCQSCCWVHVHHLFNCWALVFAKSTTRSWVIGRLFIESKLNKSIQSVEIKVSYSSRRKTPYQRLFSSYYLKRLSYLLYGSVASLPSQSSNIEAWPYGTSLRFASLLHLGH